MGLVWSSGIAGILFLSESLPFHCHCRLSKKELNSQKFCYVKKDGLVMLQTL